MKACKNISGLMLNDESLPANFGIICCLCSLFVNTTPLPFQCHSGNKIVKRLFIIKLHIFLLKKKKRETEKDDVTYLSQCESYCKAVSMSGDKVPFCLNFLHQRCADLVGLFVVLTKMKQNLTRLI